ncbi:RidA family protein [Candidatus Bipolaricaulota bacterium]|nr:RidA family protein [Candidatus Bipolaricaulota bacterium]
MNNYEDRLEEIGITIPDPPEPAGAYIPARRAGNLVFCSGQGPMQEGEVLHRGKVGSDLSVEEGYEAARVAAINCLAEIKSEVGSLNKIDRIVKVRGFVSSAPGFNKQPDVVNGASEVLEEIFGENGKHARAALGVSELPLNIPVEVEMVVSLD